MSALIERVRNRCEEVGDCWEWTGYCEGPRSKTPMLKLNGRQIAVRRAIALDLGLLSKSSNKFAVAKCRNWRCVNPAHVQVLTRQIVAKRAFENCAGGRVLIARKIAAARRKRAKLTLELASEIRNAEGSYQAIGAQYGISKSTVSDIKTGRIWRDYSSAFSNLVEAVT